MARREIRRWIAAPPSQVFAAVCAQTLSFCQLSNKCALYPACGAEPRIGATAVCRSRRGACRLRVISLEQDRVLELIVTDAGHLVHIRFEIEPSCDGSLTSFVSESDGPFPASARSAIAPVFRAFGDVLTEVKSSLEQQREKALA
jgi:hypothetical protein